MSPEEQKLRPDGWLCKKHDNPEVQKNDSKGNTRLLRYAQLNKEFHARYYSVHSCDLYQVDLDRQDSYEDVCDCTDEPVCPYCGFVYLDAPYLDFTNDTGSEQCENCGEIFYYETETIISYTTKRRPDVPAWFKRNQENLGRSWE
jgi:hypothetical protein